MLRVLVVAEAGTFASAAADQLTRDGFAVDHVARLSDAVSHVDRSPAARPAAVIVDVSLDPALAREVCSVIRVHFKGPLLVVASGPATVDLSCYLDLGADDYLPRPERLRELVARTRALIRRRADRAGEVRSRGSCAVGVGDVWLDPVRHEVWVRGARMSLPLKQFQILELLLANAGRVLTRPTILERVWGTDVGGESNSLEVQIRRLRMRVEEDPARPTRIKTVRGLGYLYNSDGATRSPGYRGPRIEVTGSVALTS